jgi:outer membrane protein OmpA-like peptidoglycan-associated protein
MKKFTFLNIILTVIFVMFISTPVLGKSGGMGNGNGGIGGGMGGGNGNGSAAGNSGNGGGIGGHGGGNSGNGVGGVDGGNQGNDSGNGNANGPNGSFSPDGADGPTAPGCCNNCTDNGWEGDEDYDEPTVIVKPKTVKIKGLILFNFNKYTINQTETPILEKIAYEIKKNSNISLALAGYTDKFGSNKYNQTLSEKRANSVKKHLIKLGVPTECIVSIKGFGKTILLPKMTHRENRRVTILSVKTNN